MNYIELQFSLALKGLFNQMEIKDKDSDDFLYDFPNQINIHNIDKETGLSLFTLAIRQKDYVVIKQMLTLVNLNVCLKDANNNFPFLLAYEIFKNTNDVNMKKIMNDIQDHHSFNPETILTNYPNSLPQFAELGYLILVRNYVNNYPVDQNTANELQKVLDERTTRERIAERNYSQGKRP